MIGYDKRITAKSLSEEDFRQKRRGDRWSYFEALRTRILDDVEAGGCTLLDEAVQARDFYMVDKVALTDAAQICLEGAMPMQYENGIRFLRNCGNNCYERVMVHWEELNHLVHREQPQRVSEDERTLWRKLQNYARQRQIRPAGGQNGLRQELEDLRAANRDLNAALEERDREINRLKGELQAGEEARQEVTNQLQALREQLQSEKEALLAPARQDAEAIRADARRQAEEEAAHILNRAENDAQRLRAERCRAIQELWQEEHAKGEGERQIYTDQLTEFRADLTSETSRFQGEVVDRLNTAVEELNRVKRELCTDLRAWQEGLYRAQYESLAMCYVNLVRILAKGNELAMAEKAPSGESPGEMARLLSNLDRFRWSLEKAMLRLGLRVYYAQPGELFDPARHAEAGADAQERDYEAGFRVRRCTAPGVEHHISEDQDSRNLIRAEVELEE